jgi:ketosteroid isomerase-like protein
MKTNREIAQSYWDAEMRRDLDAVLLHYRPDATFAAPGWAARGHDEIRKYYEDSFSSYPGLEVSIVRELTSGTESVFEWLASMITDAGVRVPLRGVNCVTIMDGKLAEVRAYYDPSPLSASL